MKSFIRKIEKVKDLNKSTKPAIILNKVAEDAKETKIEKEEKNA